MLVFFKRLIMNILYLFSFISIRNKRIWVFGSYGNFNDNSRYLFLSMQDKAQIRSIWIAKNRSELIEVRKYNKNCYLRYSLKGLYYCLRAKVYIYSAYVADINYITSGNAICVNLWHGIPLKKIEFDIVKGDLAHVFNGSLKSRFFHPWVYKKNDYVLSPNQFVADYSFKKAFRVSQDQIIIGTYPRVINLIRMQEEYKKENNLFTFLYAPTWRDANPNFLSKDDLDLDIIERFCIENDSIFLIKLHSNSEFKVDSKKYNRVRVLDNSIDSNEAMVISDCLITDYSSIYFDYIYLNKPIIFYRFDEKEYINNSREFYTEVYKFVPGHICNDFYSLIRTLKIVSGNNNDSHEDLIKILDLFHNPNHIFDLGGKIIDELRLNYEAK